MGNSAASALREANGGSADSAWSAGVTGCSCGSGRAGRPAARRAGASAALPVLSLASAPKDAPLSPGSPLRKKLSGMTAATYVPDPTVPAV